MSGIGKPVRHKDKATGEKVEMGTVDDEVSVIVDDYKNVLQRIRHNSNAKHWGGIYGWWDDSEWVYRTGYYTYDKNGKSIVWGQYTQFVSEKELKQLLALARAKGWDIFGG
jgi:hypothetical protein